MNDIHTLCKVLLIETEMLNMLKRSQGFKKRTQKIVGEECLKIQYMSLHLHQEISTDKKM